MYVFANPNPAGIFEEDCAVRAFALATGRTWDSVFLDLAMMGYSMKRMPDRKPVYRGFLRAWGFEETMLPNKCPDCHSVRDFCADNPTGTYILATGDHVVCVISGDYFDTWDSGDETPTSVWRRKEG
jgi:hypothetical protein